MSDSPIRPEGFEFVFATDDLRCDGLYVEITYCGSYVCDVLPDKTGVLNFERADESFLPPVRFIPVHKLIEALTYAQFSLTRRNDGTLP
jgi:hypothetical protein